MGSALLPPPPSLGVFDSGLGGLTVVREIRRRMPGESLVYVGDTGNAPYGALPEARIRDLSLGLARFLLTDFGCRGLVIACNTATAAAAEAVRAATRPVPVVAMEPAVKPATRATKTGIVGVLATVGTLTSARFAALLERYRGEVEFLTQPCPGFVEAVEEGRVHTAETRALVEGCVRPLIERGADTLVLGCTHYPVLRPLIAEAAGPGVTLIDTGDAVARRVAEVFAPASGSGEGRLELFTTGDTRAFARGVAAILGLSSPPAVRRLIWKNGELTTDATN
jgi:glutamate racemase